MPRSFKGWDGQAAFDGTTVRFQRGVSTHEGPEHDPASLTFGMGTGLTHESLPFAAAVVAALRPPPSPPPPAVEPGTGAAERLRRLRDEELLTEEEFQAKKAELLRDL